MTTKAQRLILKSYLPGQSVVNVDIGKLAKIQLPDIPEPEKLTTELAEAYLKQLVTIDHQLDGFATTVRMAIGRLLLAIQEAGLHLDMGYSNWQAFLEQGIPKLCKRQWRFAYRAISMAQSNALAALKPDVLEKIPVSNATTLVRIEKAGTPVTSGLIKKATNLPAREFSREVGATQGRNVSTWSETKEQGTELQRVMDILRSGSGDALQNLANLLVSVEMIREAGDGIDNKIDLLLSTMMLHFQEKITSEDIHHSNLPPNPETGAPPWEESHEATIDYLKDQADQAMEGP